MIFLKLKYWYGFGLWVGKLSHDSSNAEIVTYNDLESSAKSFADSGSLDAR
jgi:hypothetical protein